MQTNNLTFFKFDGNPSLFYIDGDGKIIKTEYKNLNEAYYQVTTKQEIIFPDQNPELLFKHISAQVSQERIRQITFYPCSTLVTISIKCDTPRVMHLNQNGDLIPALTTSQRHRMKRNIIQNLPVTSFKQKNQDGDFIVVILDDIFFGNELTVEVTGDVVKIIDGGKTTEYIFDGVNFNRFQDMVVSHLIELVNEYNV